MQGQAKERWMKLCVQAAEVLAREMTRLLNEEPVRSDDSSKNRDQAKLK